MKFFHRPTAKFSLLMALPDYLLMARKFLPIKYKVFAMMLAHLWVGLRQISNWQNKIQPINHYLNNYSNKNDALKIST